MTHPLERDSDAGLFASLIRDLPFIGIALIAPGTGQWLEVNDRLCEMLGYSREELLATTWPHLTHPDDLAADLARFEFVMAGESDGYTIEKRFVGKGGGSVEVVVNLKCVRHADGSVAYLVKTLRDSSERKLGEKALRDAEDFGRAILDAVSAQVAVLDRDGVIVAVNEPWRVFARENGANGAQMPLRSDVGSNYLDVCRTAQGESAEGALAVFDGIRAVLEGEAGSFSHEYPCHAPGQQRWFVVNVIPLGGGHDGAVVSHTDISASRQMSEALRTAHEQLARAQRSAGAGIWDWDMITGKMEWSVEFFRLLGLDPAMAEASLETWRGIVHGDDITAAEERVQLAVRNHQPLENEYRVVLPSGEIRWISALGDTTYDYDGRPVRMSGICLDVTARKQADAVLRAERDTSQRYLDTVEAIIVALDAAGRITLLNRKGHSLLGYATGELDGENWFERCVPSPEGMAQVYPVFRKLMAGELASVEYVENPIVTRNGERRLIAWHNSLLHDDTGRIIGSLSAGEDITERRHAEDALRFQFHLNRSITDKATDSIFVNDAEGRVTFVNPEALRVFGYGEAELMGQNLHDVIHHTFEDGGTYPMRECPLCQVYRTGEVIRDHEAVFFRKDGSPVHVTASNAALEADGRPVGAVLVLHDVTARKQAEQALRERDADLNRAQAVGHIGSWRLDVRHNELTWSEENHRIFGVPAGTPMTYETFLSCVHPDDRAYVDQMWQAGLRGAPYDIEHRLLVNGAVKWVREKAELEFDADGSLLGGFGTTQDISELKAAEQALDAARAAAIEEKNMLETVMQTLPVGVAIVDARGGTIRNNTDYERIWGGPRPAVHSVDDYAAYQAWWEASGQPVQPHEWASALALQTGQLVANQLLQIQRFDGTRAFVLNSAAPIRDAHGRIIGSAVVVQDVTILKQAEQSLREADQRKDEFLAMLAHELRNPLAPIRNAAHVLGRLDLDEPRVRWVQGILERQVAHLTHLVDELLDVSRIARGKVSLKKTRIELADLVRQACESVQPLMSAKGHRFEVRMPEAGVMLEGDLVRLVQVLQNLLNNAAKYTPDGGCIELTGRLLGQEVELQVRDNGMGIPSDLLPGVFDLFRQGERTLDRAQGGLGIGLTLVRRLVELHGGRVEAHSAGPGQGATFSVRLPAADHATGEPASVDGKPLMGTLRQRVLVVDDDPAVAESMVVFLELEGHQVRSAASGEVALRLLQAFRPQVVLLDIGLPGQDGYEVARRIRQAPGGDVVKLVAVSGYGHEEAMERSRQAGFDRHLVKPVDPEVLGALLAEMGGES